MLNDLQYFSPGERPLDEANMINFHGKNVPAPPKSIPPPIPGMSAHKNVQCNSII